MKQTNHMQRGTRGKWWKGKGTIPNIQWGRSRGIPFSDTGGPSFEDLPWKDCWDNQFGGALFPVRHPFIKWKSHPKSNAWCLYNNDDHITMTNLWYITMLVLHRPSISKRKKRRFWNSLLNTLRWPTKVLQHFSSERLKHGVFLNSWMLSTRGVLFKSWMATLVNGSCNALRLLQISTLN